MSTGLLAEQQQVERAVARVRWGGAALAFLLGPLFPNLSIVAVLGLGVAVVIYNVVVLRASAGAGSHQEHARVVEWAFAADLAAVSVAMLIFSVDVYWTTFFIGTVVVVGGAFRFGSSGAYTAAVVLTIALVAISIFRVRAFGYELEPERIAFHVSVYGLIAVLIDRVLRDDRRLRAEREALIRRLERRVAEDVALASVLRIVATAPPGEEVVPRLLQASREVFHFDRATVFIIDEEAGEYRAIYRLTPPGESSQAPRFALGQGLIAAALASDAPLLSRNVLEDARYVPLSRDEPARSVIIVPLTVGGRALAALSLSRALPEVFGPDDVRLAETVAGLIAQVLENQRLFAEASEARALRELDRLKDEFLATVSHELRTPLTVISGSLELLGRHRDQVSAQARRLIEQAERHVHRLQRNVEDLLDLAQLQEAKIVLEREFTSPRGLLTEAAAAAEVMAAQRGQAITVACPDDLPPALVDRRRMLQVLGNLVTNAIRYAPEGTRIELRAGRAGDDVRFSVVDEGPGIPPQERERVFDKFYRLERTKDAVSGTGLGLAIARTLIQLHGGRIWVEEAPSGGSAFTVSVPHEVAPALAVERSS